MVTARMVPASMINTAPLNSSINVSLRLSVVSTPHNSYWLSVRLIHYFQQCLFQEAVPVAGSTANKYQ
jgi:hypothetical protein